MQWLARPAAAAVLWLALASALPAQSVVVSHDPAAQHRGVVRVIDVLADQELQAAVLSGLPLRIRFRAELWQDGFIDDLLAAESWSTVLTYDPLSERFVVRTRNPGAPARLFTDYHSARAAIEGAYVVSLRPTGNGRFYYTATVDIETLSLSDLEELERWLKGQLQPAVSGERSITGAIGQGARRLFMRVLALPERRFEGRSNRFRLP
jgi:hypothetical protein